MLATLLSLLSLVCPVESTAPAPGGPRDLAKTYAKAVEELNAAHARKPVGSEAELEERFPKKASKALEQLLQLKITDGLAAALEETARAALELDRIEDFDRARAALSEISVAFAADLGVAYSSKRVLVIAEGGLTRDYAEHFAGIVEDVLAAYDEVFGFTEFSKVPGKKLRVRVHLEDAITNPPHFAPQYAYHSEIDFPVIDAERLRSPTAQGHFMFYGLCHELGHVIAMWDRPSNKEDHHAWAHYTGVVIVEHMAEARKQPKWLDDCKDVRWRSMTKEMKRLKGVQPSRKDHDGVLAMLFAVHELVGPETIGAAINALDEKDKRLRINRVRYYTFDELRGALVKAEKNKKKRKTLEKLLE